MERTAPNFQVVQPSKVSRLQGKRYLLTYPRCTLTKEEVLEALQSSLSLKAYTVARELHQDGTPHVHACIHLESSPNTTNMRYFDIHAFHPNIASLKNKSDWERASKYCQKDGDFLTSCSECKSKRTILFEELLQNPGGLTKEFILTHPEIMAYNYSSLKQWMSYVVPPLPIPRNQLLPKRRHIWIFGPSNTGKSYWLNARLELSFEPQELPRNNDYTGFNLCTDLVYCDEYKAQLSIQELNRLCDGRTKLNTKGGTTIIAFPMLLIVSNFSIDRCYQKEMDPEILRSLHNRFDQYDSSIKFPRFPSCEL